MPSVHVCGSDLYSPPRHTGRLQQPTVTSMAPHRTPQRRTFLGGVGNARVRCTTGEVGCEGMVPCTTGEVGCEGMVRCKTGEVGCEGTGEVVTEGSVERAGLEAKLVVRLLRRPPLRLVKEPSALRLVKEPSALRLVKELSALNGCTMSISSRCIFLAPYCGNVRRGVPRGSIILQPMASSFAVAARRETQHRAASDRITRHDGGFATCWQGAGGYHPWLEAAYRSQRHAPSLYDDRRCVMEAEESLACEGNTARRG